MTKISQTTTRKLWERRAAWVCLLLGPLFLLHASPHRSLIRQAAFDPQAVDEFIAQQMTVQRVPGLALALTRGDQVLYVQGYGTAQNGRPVTAQTQFFIASVSKSFTALAVMQLVEAGKINLDARVQDFLPEFTLADPGLASQITIRHLLNHTSGLSETVFPDMALPQPTTIAGRVSSLHSARPTAQPGTEYHYFSPNYALLARVIEVASGQPYSEYIESRVFSPLAMKHTFNVITSMEGKAKADLLAQGHLLAFGIPIPYPEADGYLGGSGGVISTAEDMAHYLIAQNNAGRYLDQQLVTPESLLLMHTPPPNIGSTYAMGWTESVSDGERVLEHNGILSAFSAHVILVPDQSIGIALLYDISSFPTNAFGQPQIRDGLIALLSGRPVKNGGMTVRTWSWLAAGLTLLGGTLALRSLLRLPRWAEKSHTIPVWRLLPGIAWAFMPALALLGIPALTARFADRVFGFTNLYKSMLDIFVWLGLTGVLGVINGAVRIAILLRRSIR